MQLKEEYSKLYYTTKFEETTNGDCGIIKNIDR